MNKVTILIRAISETLEILNKHRESGAVAPETGHFYRTFNDSIVYVHRKDYLGYSEEYQALVLKGGHNTQIEVGESYTLDDSGYAQESNSIGTHLLLSLAEDLKIAI